jgi:succinoglycan biosynthesis protein ExoV
MPHWYSAENGDWRTVCAQAGMHYIDPLGGVEQVLSEIQATRLLITEALHGAIVADALRVPWVPVVAYKHILALKWLDWCESLGLDYRPYHLRPLYGEAAIRKRLERTPRWSRLSQWAAGPATAAGDGLERLWARQNARTLRQIAREASPQLSNDATVATTTEQMLAEVERLKEDYWNGRLD